MAKAAKKVQSLTVAKDPGPVVPAGPIAVAAPAVPEVDDGMGTEVIVASQGTGFGQYGNPQSVQAIGDMLAQLGAETAHVGGSLPPAFGNKPREGSCRVVIPIEFDSVPEEHGGFDLLVVDVVDPKARAIAYRASIPATKGLTEFFGTKEAPAQTYTDSKGKTKDIGWGDALYAVTFVGALEPKGNKAPMKIWRIDAVNLPKDVKIKR